MGTRKGHVSNFQSCCINNDITYLLSSPHPNLFLLGPEVRSSFILERISIGKVDLWVYVSIVSGLEHYGDERYFQSFY